MDYEVSFSAEEGIVRITVYAPIDADLELKFAAEAIALANRENAKLFLADVRRSPNVASTYNQYSLAYDELPAMALDRRSRIAIIVAEQDLSHDFIEIVFRNAGYVCEKFLDEDSALEWLRR